MLEGKDSSPREPQEQQNFMLCFKVFLKTHFSLNKNILKDAAARDVVRQICSGTRKKIPWMVLVALGMLIVSEVTCFWKPAALWDCSGAEILPAGRLVVSCWTQSAQGTAASGEGIWLWCSLFYSLLVLSLIQTLSRTAHEPSLYDTALLGASSVLAPSCCSLPGANYSV